MPETSCVRSYGYWSMSLSASDRESEHGTFHVCSRAGMGHFMFSGRYLRAYARNNERFLFRLRITLAHAENSLTAGALEQRLLVASRPAPPLPIIMVATKGGARVVHGSLLGELMAWNAIRTHTEPPSSRTMATKPIGRRRPTPPTPIQHWRF